MRQTRIARAPGSVRRLAAGLAAVTIVVSACGAGRSSSATSTFAPQVPTTTPLAATPTTSAPAASPTSATVTGTTTTSVGAGGGAGAASVSAWQRDAQQYHGQNGKKFTIDCPPKGTPASIWGTGIYTDDSSICNAAVHLGLLTYSSGGKVEYQIVPGQSSYAGTSANGVTSQAYGSWAGSFILPAAPPTAGAVSVGLESWGRTSVEFAGQQGKRFAVACSGKGEPGTIWGANIYTSDSSVCTAAVHVGLISIATGGTVVIQIAPGQDAYKGATANGVTSSSYDSWTSSFIFPQDQTPP